MAFVLSEGRKRGVAYCAIASLSGQARVPFDSMSIAGSICSWQASSSALARRTSNGLRSPRRASSFAVFAARHRARSAGCSGHAASPGRLRLAGEKVAVNSAHCAGSLVDVALGIDELVQVVAGRQLTISMQTISMMRHPWRGSKTVVSVSRTICLM